MISGSVYSIIVKEGNHHLATGTEDIYCNFCCSFTLNI